MITSYNIIDFRDPSINIMPDYILLYFSGLRFAVDKRFDNRYHSLAHIA